MPNHVTNIITVVDSGDLTKEEVIKKLIPKEGYHFDFNTFIPKPKCLEDFNAHMGIFDIACIVLGLKNKETLYPQHKELYDKYKAGTCEEADKVAIDRAISNYKECGYMYWYDWCHHAWGTKWNAYDCSEDYEEGVIRFQTAWSHPIIIIGAMAKMLPDVTFKIEFADEDTGSNCGWYIIKGEEMIEDHIFPNWSNMDEENRREATKFAFNLCNPNTDPREYGYDPETFEYDEKFEEEFWKDK